MPGHRARGGTAAPWPLDGLPGAGALRSTGDDMLRYLGAQLDPDSTPLADAIRLTQTLRVQGRLGAVGLGSLHSDRPHALWWHNGGTGGYRSFAAFVPERQAAVVVLSSSARSVDPMGLRAIRVAVER
ncbi:hypothetical protein GCM10027026_39000 [Myroides odoratimimus subsp. xuanwuensis]